MASMLEWYDDSQLVVALLHVADAGRYGGAVMADGRVLRFHARGTPGPGLINAGCYLVNKDIFRRYPMPEKFPWEQDFLEARAAEVRPIAFPCDVPFIDNGIPEAFQQAQTLLPAWTHPGLENR
jgi:D-glycero-alpha-D-manno-heptose 1-phosphate guanylyltransferase